MNLLFFLLKPELRFFATETESYQDGTSYCSKGLCGGTTHFQLTSGITEEGNAYFIKGRSGVGHKYENMSLGQCLTSSLEELRQFLVFWFSIHDGDENCV